MIVKKRYSFFKQKWPYSKPLLNLKNEKLSEPLITLIYGFL